MGVQGQNLLQAAASLYAPFLSRCGYTLQEEIFDWR